MKIFFVFSLICLLGLFCSKTKSSDKEKEIFLLGLAVSSSSLATNTSNSTQNFNCQVANPPFFSLAQAGTTSNCSGCHSGSSAQANFDVTSYSSVLSRVQTGNPEGSLLYQKITTGSMKGNSTQSINQAVYCWIIGGANP